ncbi:MAG: YraN family protein ['Candidatus Kapabacteria' thiocyanatum]|uniref:UPF0102 protein BGO89_00735 n=1 Tax=Candidatus Kapaibacterium thiocyanatum TaxID=1895771 RepID=A0A1M3L6E4_9BACT|nr:YraN family protein ['Candidatus Kapabacteria' thiocyanatum]OJX61153.1 MAG: YraN family protein ['Candidatus Kapabacteria' thiocyanatum]
MSTDLGQRAEQRACDHLVRNGYEILDRNFRFARVGELDIVARHGDTIVFVEVRYRTYQSYGSPEASITRRKVERLRRTAGMWLSMRNVVDVPCRFDVIAVEMMTGNSGLRHLVDAFT